MILFPSRTNFSFFSFFLSLLVQFSLCSYKRTFSHPQPPPTLGGVSGPWAVGFLPLFTASFPSYLYDGHIWHRREYRPPVFSRFRFPMRFTDRPHTIAHLYDGLIWHRREYRPPVFSRFRLPMRLLDRPHTIAQPCDTARQARFYNPELATIQMSDFLPFATCISDHSSIYTLSHSSISPQSSLHLYSPSMSDGGMGGNGTGAARKAPTRRNNIAGSSEKPEKELESKALAVRWL